MRLSCWSLLAALLALLALLYIVVDALRVPLLVDASWLLDLPTLAAASAAFALLVVDSVLPVPSSVVMTTNGALFGVVGGAIVSLAGATVASLLAFALGRRSGSRIDRFVSPEDRRRADRLLSRWGTVAVVMTRPVPLLAEAVAFMAGASPIPWARFTVATVAGTVPGATTYAVAGAAASDADPLSIVALVLAMAALFWLFAMRLDVTATPASARSSGASEGGTSGGAQ